LEAGVIPQFALPGLRNFYLSTSPFFDLGASAYAESEDGYSRRTWNGLPEYLPGNATPSSAALERFAWHADDDSDYYDDEVDDGWFWTGPTAATLFERLHTRDLKHLEVAVGHDDHENGSEGVIAAPLRSDPRELSPALESVSLNGDDLHVLAGSSQELKGLRIFENAADVLVAFLSRPVCSGLESLHVDDRHGYWPSGRWNARA
jgi:hypothetical protein